MSLTRLQAQGQSLRPSKRASPLMLKPSGLDQADREGGGLVAAPARAAGQAADDLDAAVGHRLLVDPLVRRAAAGQRPARLDQALERGRRRMLGIIHDAV
jgi:hypothetical protein